MQTRQHKQGEIF